ncbi:MAG TPA: response regulator [Pseudolabrys sp.]|nr:response regulator [Pseudolabrys sp.]
MAQKPLAGKRCLVLDDEFLISLDIQLALENAGAVPIAASNAADAVALLKTEPRFDVAVVDIVMNEKSMSGLTVAAALAEQSIPFVFLTGYTADNVNVRQFPAAPLIEKPYQVAELIAALQKAIGS